MAGSNAIVDVFDMGDFRLETTRDAVKGYGGIIIETQPMSNGVGFVVSRVIQRLGPGGAGRLQALRFWGHGVIDQPTAYIAYGPPHQRANEKLPPPIPWTFGVAPAETHASAIGFVNFALVGPMLAPLRPYFASGGRIEFRQCLFGKFPDGKTVMSEMAKMLGVAVQAPEKSQDRGELWVPPVWEASPTGVLRILSDKEIIEVRERR
jgi:hypothetical protein